MQVPEGVMQLQSYVGLTNFLQSFIPYIHRIEPLWKLLKKEHFLLKLNTD